MKVSALFFLVALGVYIGWTLAGREARAEVLRLVRPHIIPILLIAALIFALVSVGFYGGTIRVF